MGIEIKLNIERVKGKRKTWQEKGNAENQKLKEKRNETRRKMK